MDRVSLAISTKRKSMIDSLIICFVFRSLIGLFSGHLAGIINTVPGWIDSVVILPDCSFQILSYIVNLLYNNYDEKTTQNFNQKDFIIERISYKMSFACNDLKSMYRALTKNHTEIL